MAAKVSSTSVLIGPEDKRPPTPLGDMQHAGNQIHHTQLVGLVFLPGIADHQLRHTSPKHARKDREDRGGHPFV
jgi:hypothetical protein